MKFKGIIFAMLAAASGLAAPAFAFYDKSDLDKIALFGEDLPEGFVFGVIPEAAKNTLRDNPWHFDRPAIQKLTGKIYPDGDYRRVSDIHISVIADEKRPFGDDMVCCMILFKDTASAKIETAKLRRYVSFNGDRALLLVRDNLAVFLYADDAGDLERLRVLADKISSRIK